jgi:DNA-binding MarR family transcriptional regulator
MTETTPFSQSVQQWMDTFTHRSMRDWSRYIKSQGFSMPQFFLLMHLRHHANCGISDLSEHMEITNAAASQLVDKLVHAGLLERVEDPYDRRAKQINLSSKGKELIEQGIQKRYRWVEELESSMTKAEKEKVYEALTLMVRMVDKLERSPTHEEIS